MQALLVGLGRETGEGGANSDGGRRPVVYLISALGYVLASSRPGAPPPQRAAADGCVPANCTDLFACCLTLAVDATHDATLVHVARAVAGNGSAQGWATAPPVTRLGVRACMSAYKKSAPY
jgi:hypothetical protein